MRELSLNILDIAQNSIKAGATLVGIAVRVSDGVLSITITDNGCGMSKDFLAKVTDPFTTTRTTRKVGMGLPLIKMGAEQSGGTFTIESEVGKGTEVTTTYLVDSIDRFPLGDVAETVSSLILAVPDIDFVFDYCVDGRKYKFDTRELREALGGLPLDDCELNEWIKATISQNINEINGGLIL